MNRTREFIAAIAISTQLLLPAAVLAAEEETAERTEASQTGGSSQRAKTGVGGAASPAARQALAGSSSFLSTGLLVGTATFGVVLAIALKTETAAALDLGDRASEVRAVISANVIHISPWTTCLGLLRLASELLPPGRPLCLYGPFKRGGRHTAASNESFDEQLRSRDPAWGVRDLDEVANAASEVLLSLDQVIEMPANNWVVVFRK